jgi:hypothetical protein
VQKSANLATEQGYVLRTLPSGIIRVINEGMHQRDLRVLGQIAAIISGMLVTLWGYLVGSVRARPTLPA